MELQVYAAGVKSSYVIFLLFESFDQTRKVQGVRSKGSKLKTHTACPAKQEIIIRFHPSIALVFSLPATAYTHSSSRFDAILLKHRAERREHSIKASGLLLGPQTCPFEQRL
jgi:hypothetical protein